jgi:nicotinamide mononucleotide adenylyltransferase
MFIACGSYNPPTFMHLRMFEIAKDHFTQMGFEVIGGIMSPVHDAYGKKGLVSQTHRHSMLKIATKSSDWIRISEWEMQQEGWSRTRMTLQFHQNYVNSIIRDLNGLNSKSNWPSWVPDNIRQTKDPVQVKLLCGADLLESFATPGLWEPDDIAAILGHHGVVVVSRNNSDLDRFIFDSDLLNKYKRNITIVTNWIPNEVSSSLVRKFIKRELSVKYLIDDLVIDYINKHGLYQTTSSDDT